MKHIFEYLFSKKSDLDKLNMIIRPYDICILGSSRKNRVFGPRMYMCVLNPEKKRILIEYGQDVNWLVLSDYNSDLTFRGDDMYNILEIWRPEFNISNTNDDEEYKTYYELVNLVSHSNPKMKLIWKR